jgi:ABC-type phosphate/phosphonate transport system permease subunit
MRDTLAHPVSLLLPTFVLVMATERGSAWLRARVA